MKDLDSTKLVFLDEAGFKTNMARAYGWAPRGTKPIIVGSPHGKHITIIGAIGVDGTRALQLIEGGMNGEKFVAYLDEVLGPTLAKGTTVIMDGPRVHRVRGVAEALEKYGARPLYLPAYSPELNPIEMCWSFLKQWARGRSPRALVDLLDAVEDAWGKVNSELCAAWARHSGYATAST